jgi:hypothetical protein
MDITDSYGLRIFLEFSKIDVTNHYVLRKVKKVEKKCHYVFCNLKNVSITENVSVIITK